MKTVHVMPKADRREPPAGAALRESLPEAKLQLTHGRNKKEYLIYPFSIVFIFADYRHLRVH